MNLSSFFSITVRSLFLLSLFPLSASGEEAKIFDQYFYGKTPQFYKQHGKQRQDVSGSAWDGKRMLLAYDGGNNSANVGVMLFPPIGQEQPFDKIWKHGKLLARSVMQRDIEGATYINGSYYTTASMSLVDEESPGYRLLAEFTLDEANHKINWERSVDLRSKLVKALESACGDKYWYGRIANVFGKRGGLNIEGLSFDPKNDSGLVLGLRSPLCSPDFGLPDFGPNLSLRKGDAILAFVDKPFSAKPQIKFSLLKLNGHGVRGIEFIPELDGYVVIGGPVKKDTDYSLWLYRTSGELSPLPLKGFSKLCRPETVASTLINGKKGLIVYSEEAGKHCLGVDFTYIAATFKQQN